MGEAKKPIIGIDLGIDPEYLEEVVRQTVSAGIAEALGGKDAVASEIVHEVLNARVDREGNVITKSSYMWSDGTPIIDHYVRKVVREEAASYVTEMMEKYRPQIRDSIEKQIKDDMFINDLSGKFVRALADATMKDWCCNIDVNFEKPKKDW